MAIPEYICHKRVKAFKIESIDYLPQGGAWLTSNLLTQEAVFVSDAYLTKHKPKVGGYYVLYKDDYESWSPAKAFEEGYTLASNNSEDSPTT